MKKVKYKDTYIYIDDSDVPKEETGVVIKEEDDLSKTQEIEISRDDYLSNTLTDIWSDDNA
ncbi:MAG: hypothetical protein IJ568_07365 [Bacilli bacterium]|nr:hypothetical protein [Bacilli bacterium]